jgi:hypothetical protein
LGSLRRRGKHSNVTSVSLGTARIGTSKETRETIRERAKRDQFRANLFETRDQALLALVERGDNAKRGATPSNQIPASKAFNSHSEAYGRLGGVSLDVQRGEISSIIGPNTRRGDFDAQCHHVAYRPTGGRIVFEGKDRTRLAPRVAGLGSGGPSRTSRSSRA